VLIAEDSERTLPLDMLEMQYYRFLIQEPDLHNHLRSPDQKRYARSCRDLSAAIPQDRVALHAAIGSKALRDALAEETGRIAIWSTSQDDLSVRSWRFAPYRVHCQHFNGWRIATDQWVIEEMMRLREEQLPNETGGILIGSIDTGRHILYIVDVVASPPDSQEWPTSYIRGCQGLQRQVIDIRHRTIGQLNYVGEWHSHPSGCSCELSQIDQQALSELGSCRRKEGLPALIGIIGEDGQFGWYLQ
jgi:proteasome lid subunit RPN8/RPN11